MPTWTRGELGVVGYVYTPADLAAACDDLRAAGCTRAVGPIEGSTWHGYRLVTWSDPDEPTFAGEPADDRAAMWEAAGFEPVETYHSAVNESPAEPDDLAEYVAAGFEGRGDVVVRGFTPADLPAAARVAAAAFAGQPFYTPPAAGDFAGRSAVADTSLVRVVELGGEVVGFCLTYPRVPQRHAVPRLNEQLAAAQRAAGEPTAILKTLAVLPDKRCEGLGLLLMRATYAACVEAGYRRVVSALMHDGNRISRKLYRGRMRVVRRYAVMGREL